LEEQIKEVKEVVELPLTHPELFEKVGIEPPKGVLLYGPPGTGKTLLAKAVAHETNASFIKIVGSELVKKFIGEGAKLVRENSWRFLRYWSACCSSWSTWDNRADY
jgi:proteasome regulatory subunit